MPKQSILVLIPMDEAHRRALEAVAPKASFTYAKPRELTDEQLSGADIILGNPPSSRLDQAGAVRWVQLSSAGTDGFTSGALSPSVRLTNSTGAYGLAIAEHMLGVTLQLMKKLYRYQDNQRAVVWKNQGEVKGIQGSTALIVGAGDIGNEYAGRYQALGGRTIGVSRSTHAHTPEYDEQHTIDALDSLLPRADVVVLCVPGTAATYRLMNEARLALMKPDAILLNTGRGTVVDTDALVRLMSAGHLWGAGLDVTDPEPLPGEHPLWKLPNVLITPHISGGFQLRETYERMFSIVRENLARYLRGEELYNQVDSHSGYVIPTTKAHFNYSAGDQFDKEWMGR